MNKVKKLENVDNFSEIYKHIDNNTTLIVHNNGEADVVVLNSGVFEEFMTAIKVNEGFREIESGRFLEHDHVKANFESKYGKLS